MRSNNQIHWLFSLILTIFILFWGISFFIPKNLVTISGEYIFSLDYKSHLSRQVQMTDWNKFVSYVECVDCWSINHYSNYFSAIHMAIASIGEALGFYPLLFYIWIIISSQLIASYIFLKLIFNNINLISFISIFILLALNTYKISLISSGSWYGLTHALLIIYYSIWIKVLRDSKHLNYNNLLKFSLLQGLIISTFFSLTINYLPYTIYTTLFLLLIFSKKLILNYKNIMIFSISSLILPIFLLFPVYSSLLKDNYQHIREFTQPANNELFFDALTFRQWNYETIKLKKLLVLFTLLTPLFIYLKNKRIYLKEKICFCITETIIIVLLMGNKFYINAYLYLFQYVPLIDSMRSSHRMYLYILMGYMYISAHWLLDKTNKIIYKLIWLSLIIFLFIPGVETFKKRVDFKFIPIDYYKVRNFLEDNDNLSLYLPAYPPLNKNLLNSYNWAISDSHVITIYSNPFSAYLPFKGLISYEQFYYPEYKIDPVMSYTAEKFDYHIDSEGITYLIIDNYFDWSLYPNFKLNKNSYSVKKRFGKITILERNIN